MSHYLLSTYMVESDEPDRPPTPEEMQTLMQRVTTLEAEMDSSGTFVFGGALHGPDAATTVDMVDGNAMMTDGPFVESKEHLGGFYIISAADLDEALSWAGKVAEAIGNAIEVRPFRATGKVADHMSESQSA